MKVRYGVACAAVVWGCTAEPEPTLESEFPGESEFATPASECDDNETGECLQPASNALILDSSASGLVSVQLVEPGVIDVRVTAESPMRDRFVAGAPVFRPRFRRTDQPIVAIISSVTEIDGGFRIETEPASLMDVFERGRIKRRYAIDLAGAAASPNSPSTVRRIGLNEGLPEGFGESSSELGSSSSALRAGGDCNPDLVDPIYEQDGLALSISPCRLQFGLTADYDIEWGGDITPDHAWIELRGNLDVGLGLELEASGSIERSREVDLVDIAVPVGNLPLDVTFSLVAGWAVSASGTASAQIGFEMNPTATVRFDWYRGDGVTSSFDYDRESSLVGPTLDLTGAAYAEVYITPTIGVEAIKALFVEAGPRFYAALDVETEYAEGEGNVRNLCYDFTIGIVPQINAGIDTWFYSDSWGPWTLDRWNYSKSLASDCHQVSGRGSSTCVEGVDECLTAADCTGLQAYTENKACYATICNRDCECELFDVDAWASQFGGSCCGDVSDCDNDCVTGQRACVDNECTCTTAGGGEATVGDTYVFSECSTAADCNDGLLDTTDTCESGDCVHTSNEIGERECERHSDCDDGDSDTIDRCDGGGCRHRGGSEAVSDLCAITSCSDGSPFTTDTCSNGECSHETIMTFEPL